ncbi:hypothetical protein [Glutamicibacter sp. JC586]|uniref:hypothetical protein n=1 Tax=Glutamicibacter sp. JC586 TaxID=2590552 RepID=UPI0013591C34|nr:hypothetical protein [Glutamicibacter sp. JC586]
MAVRGKPGIDTLVFFWCGILLWIIGVATTSLGTLFQINSSLGLNIFGMTVVHVIGLGCFVGAGIFSIIVAHKIIAMLVYLVHHHR